MHWIKLIVCIGVIVLSSCKKKEIVVCPPSNEPLAGNWLVLNEGLFQQNNSTITKIDPEFGTFANDFFSVQAERPLGDTGNDMKRYGNKIYIVVNVSSTIEVMDAATGSFIKQISMESGGQAKQPRFIDFKNGKAFISCYDGFVDVLDTSTLSITNRIPVGSNPDHLCVAGNKLYVSNSGGLNFPDLDSTVSVIDINSEIELSKIVVGENPGSIEIGGNGDVYVVSRGDFAGTPSRMHRISAATESKVESYSFDASQLTEVNGNIAVFENVGTTSIKLFDVSNNALISSELLNLSGITTPYKVQFEESKQRYFIFDANGYVNQGFVFEYDVSGLYVSKTQTGLVPTSILTF